MISACASESENDAVGASRRIDRTSPPVYTTGEFKHFMKTYTFKVVVEPDEGGFHAYCPALRHLTGGLRSLPFVDRCSREPQSRAWEGLLMPTTNRETAPGNLPAQNAGRS